MPLLLLRSISLYYNHLINLSVSHDSLTLFIIALFIIVVLAQVNNNKFIDNNHGIIFFFASNIIITQYVLWC